MARSEEALARRAEKRKNTVTEQKNIDLDDVKKRQKLEVNNYDEQLQRHHNNINNNDDNPLKEVGAWKCPSCKNENFASRRFCNSKMCDERRPSNIPSTSYSTITNNNNNNNRYSSRPPIPTNQQQYNRRPPPNRNSKPPTTRSRTTTKKVSRHDEATSKKLIYPKQADRATMSKNLELRKRFLESSGGGKGMDPKDIERAEILIARDERKRQKKDKSKKTTSPTTISPTLTTAQGQLLIEQQTHTDKKGRKDGKKKEKNTEEGEEQHQKMKKEKNEKADVSKSKRDKNKALRNRYKKTRGNGMKPEQITRAKQLIERDESKQRKRRKAAAEAENES